MHLDRRQIVQVADVRAEHDLPAQAQADRILQVPAAAAGPAMLPVAGHGGCSVPASAGVKHDRHRGIAPGAAENLKSVRPNLAHRIVHRPHDGAIVDQEYVGDLPQSLQGVRQIDGHRLLAHVSAGADERLVQGVHEQMVQRRIREHYAQVGIARRHGLRDGWRCGQSLPPQQHDRGPRAIATAGLPPPIRGNQRRTSSNVRSITASGLSGRCLRSRSRRTAASLVASTSS